VRLASLDFEFTYGDAECDEFASERSLMDFDVVIWDPVGSMDTYVGEYGTEHYRGRPSLSEHRSAKLISDFDALAFGIADGLADHAMDSEHGLRRQRSASTLLEEYRPNIYRRARRRSRARRGCRTAGAGDRGLRPHPHLRGVAATQPELL